MSITLSQTGSILGGIGLFLLGMRLMTDGLKLAAGPALRTVLSKSTSTPFKGVLSGAFITALVQSSSAVTVATIGFANAGLLSLSQSIYVIFGTNIGTTVTGWLVAIVGFHVNIKAFALPAIGLGMGLRIARGQTRFGMLGEAVSGFGVFFLGIEVLKTTFSEFSQGIELLSFGGSGAEIILLTGVGFLLTVLMQSSSAALTIILTSAGGGVLPVNVAACMVIGANIGTTSTAALAVIGATPNAKRIASAHLAFNSITGLAALLLLPLLLMLLTSIREALGLNSEPAAILALFHTIFNILGVLLLWPFTSRLVRFLEKRFRSAEEIEAKPRYLDRTIAATPSLGLNSLLLELHRVAVISFRMAETTIRRQKAHLEMLTSKRAAISNLVDAIGEFVTWFQPISLSEQISAALPNLLRIATYLNEIADLSLTLAKSQQALEPIIGQQELQEELASYRAQTIAFLEKLEHGFLSQEVHQAADELQKIVETYRELKASLLRSGMEGRLPVRQLVSYTENILLLRRISERAEKIFHYLDEPQIRLSIAELALSTESSDSDRKSIHAD